MRHEPLIFLHLKLVAKIGVAVATLAALALVTVVLLITNGAGDSYDAIIRSNSLTRQHLGMAMLVAGLALVVVAGLITWLIVLYTSFRVAGPLYRFSQNLKLANTRDAVELTALRKGDALTAQAAGIQQAVATLRQHQADLEAAAKDAASALSAGRAGQYADALARLKMLDDKVRL